MHLPERIYKGPDPWHTQYQHRMLYNVFHQFWQAKFAYGCLISSSSQFLLLPLNTSENGARFKNGQNQLKKNHHATII
jgi:hypothetical protein